MAGLSLTSFSDWSFFDIIQWLVFLWHHSVTGLSLTSIDDWSFFDIIQWLVFLWHHSITGLSLTSVDGRSFAGAGRLPSFSWFLWMSANDRSWLRGWSIISVAPAFLPQPAMILQHFSAVNRQTLDEVTSNRNVPAVLLYIDDTSAMSITNPGQERYSFAFSASAVVRKRGDDFPQNMQSSKASRFRSVKRILIQMPPQRYTYGCNGNYWE